jgi:hypothetical protein
LDGTWQKHGNTWMALCQLSPLTRGKI